MSNDLSMFFQPSSIAIVGVSRNPKKAGYGILENVMRTFPFKDRIYPVNPSAKKILDLPVFSSLREIPDSIDLVILFVPPKIIPDLLEQCSKKQVKGVIIESAGFAEVGQEGKQIQEQIRELGQKFKIRIWGGNCMGTVTDELITTFEPIPEEIRIKGGLSLVGQSGYFSGAIVLQCFTERFLGIRKACSIGNRIDVDECDLLEDFLTDDKTSVAAFYLEGFKRPRRFIEIAKSTKKPIICLLGGQSVVGKRAALSHTSSTASGSPELLSGMLKQAGIIQVQEFGEFFNTVEAFLKLPIPINKNLGIITITGAGGVIAADIAAQTELEIPQLSSEATKALQEVFPSWMPPRNPVDSWPAFELHEIDGALKQIFPILLNDDTINSIILMLACMSVAITFDPKIISSITSYNKPVITYLVGDKKIKDVWTSVIRKHGGIVCDDIKSCVKSIETLYLWGKQQLKEVF